MMQAATIVDQFGEEIEADFHTFFGLDLLDWFRGVHPWGKLVRLSHQLPRHSRYVAAMYEDDAIAALILEQENANDGTSKIGLSGWTFERELLVTLVERVASLESTLIGVNSKNGKPPKVPTLPRPHTRVDTLRRESHMGEAFAIADMFRPKEV